MQFPPVSRPRRSHPHRRTRTVALVALGALLGLLVGAMVATAVLCLLFMQAIEAYFVDDGMPQVLWLLLGLLAFREASPGIRQIPRRLRGQAEIGDRAWAGQVLVRSRHVCQAPDLQCWCPLRSGDDRCRCGGRE